MILITIGIILSILLIFISVIMDSITEKNTLNYKISIIILIIGIIGLGVSLGFFIANGEW